MIKAVTLFLILIAILAMFGKIGWLGRQIGIGRRPGKLGQTKPCPRCGRHVIGSGPCDCGGGPGGSGPGKA